MSSVFACQNAATSNNNAANTTTPTPYGGADSFQRTWRSGSDLTLTPAKDCREHFASSRGKTIIGYIICRVTAGRITVTTVLLVEARERECGKNAQKQVLSISSLQSVWSPDITLIYGRATGNSRTGIPRNPAVFKFPREFPGIFDFQLFLIFGMYNFTI